MRVVMVSRALANSSGERSFSEAVVRMKVSSSSMAGVARLADS